MSNCRLVKRPLAPRINPYFAGMSKPFSLIIILLAAWATSRAQVSSKDLLTPVNASDHAAFVNPFIGTGAVDSNSLSGSNFPGACMPFGLVQLSPDTRESPDD